MYKVLLVDDEILLRMNIKVMFDWEKHGFLLSGEATNGVEALKIINKEKPDIIICDISMPEMDGVQLSYELREKYPSIKFIVLSNYNDFEYVKSTLKNGAIDYILKHTLDEKVLFDSLQRAKNSIEESVSYKKDKNSNEKQTHDNLVSLREKFIIQLFNGFYKDEGEIKKHIETLDIKIETRNVLLIIMTLEKYKFIVDGSSLKDILNMKFAITNIIVEILNDYDNGMIIHTTDEKFIILLSFANNHSESKIDYHINAVLKRISICLKEFINISVNFTLGDFCNSIADIPKSYETAQQRLKNRFFTGNNSVLKNKNINEENVYQASLSIKDENYIISQIKLHSEGELFKQLDSIFNNIINKNLSFSGSYMIFGDLLSIINKICKENNIDLLLVYSSKESTHELLVKFETFDEIKSWIFTLYSKLFKLLQSSDDNLYSDYVKKAIVFVKNHYFENISLTNVSEQIDISSSYLSTLFKNEVGQGFSDYLIQLRLNIAKTLLKEGKLDIKDIVKKCGFNDYSYFFKMFKQKIGCTPKEYISKI